MHAWRERLSRWFTPLAARTPLSPNSVTIGAVLLNLVAAVLMALALDHPVLFLLAPPLIALAGLLDAFDGILARAQGKTSRLGDFLDHVCDRISDLGLIAGWLIGASVRPVVALPSLVLIMLNGYVGTQTEASFQKRSYEGVGRGEFVLALVIYPLVAWMIAVSGLREVLYGGLSLSEWMTLLLSLVAAIALIGRIRHALELARGVDHPAE